LVLRRGTWVSVQSGEIIPNIDVAVSGDRIAFVGPDASHTIGEDTQIIECEGRYLSPGFLDAHMHVESGMLTVSEFVRAVVPYGTTGMFIDPHEITNVFGLAGVRLIVDEAKEQPIHVWVQMPSCVPSAPGFETNGVNVGIDEIAEAMAWPGIIGLGEMMDFPGVYNGHEKVHAEIAAARQAGKVIGGHYASPDLGLPFHGYAAGGPQDDHEGTRAEDAVARVRQGMKVMVRYASAWHDVAEGVRTLTEMGLDSRRFLLCTDDSHCQTLVDEGHVNRAIQQAIFNGVKPLTAYQMATINTAEHFGLSNDIGLIAPGRFADIVLLQNLTIVRPEMVIARGRILARQGELTVNLPVFPYPDWATNSMHIPRKLRPDDFDINLPDDLLDKGQVLVNVIGVIENQAPTHHLRLPIQPVGNKFTADISKDIAKVAVIERHHGTQRIQPGFVHGFGFNFPCSVASTVAHDAHNLIVVGTDEEDMAIAANRLIEIGGGQVVVKEKQVIGQVALPIAGIMSDRNAKSVAKQVATVLDGFRACGCALNNPNMQLSLLGLVVIPELRISDLGIVDTNHFKFIPLIEGQ
jgi:adenine deaminase